MKVRELFNHLDGQQEIVILYDQTIYTERGVVNDFLNKDSILDCNVVVIQGTVVPYVLKIIVDIGVYYED